MTVGGASILETIAAHKRLEVAAAEVVASTDVVRERAGQASPPRDFAGVLRGGFSLIAEIKRTSPAAGTIRKRLGPEEAAELARQYVAGGARAISVLTDLRFFGGTPDHLQAARAAVAAPVLRKDFMLEPYQIYESRAMGADAVLLITALLDLAALRTLIALCHGLGMAALVEVHTEEEVEMALGAGAGLIGINNRDLRTFEVDLQTTARLRERVPPGILVVSESGIATPADVARLRPHVDAVLVGTALMASPDPAATVRALLNGGIGS